MSFIFYISGNGNPEHYWMWRNPSLKNILDNMIERGDIAPLIYSYTDILSLTDLLAAWKISRSGAYDDQDRQRHRQQRRLFFMQIPPGRENEKQLTRAAF